VLGQARRALESIGYEWVPTGAGSAEAYENGRPVEGEKYTFRLLMVVRVEGNQLVLDAESNGLRVTGATMGPAPWARIRRHFRKANRAVTESLQTAGLA
jgi:hypothetical protein